MFFLGRAEMDGGLARGRRCYQAETKHHQEQGVVTKKNRSIIKSKEYLLRRIEA